MGEGYITLANHKQGPQFIHYIAKKKKKKGNIACLVLASSSGSTSVFLILISTSYACWSALTLG